MRLAFIGCVDFSASALETVLEIPEALLVGVVTRAKSTFNSDFRSLEPLAKRAGVPCFLSDDPGASSGLAGWLRELEPDVVYCFGWSYLLGRDILMTPKLGVVGYHPAPLPRNRGRHPLIWALALGLDRTASTFFFMDEGADSGDIISQEPIEIAESDNAASLYEKMRGVALGQIRAFTPALAQGRVKRIAQDPRLATSWRKRSRSDGQVDWRMSARSVHNLVRALAPPYRGAHCVFGGKEIRLLRSEVLPETVPADLEPGKVLRVEGRQLVVKCGEGAIRLLEHGFDPMPETGGYLA